MDGVIGYTTLFAGSFAPKNWAFCQGQLIAISQNTALFSILGTQFGGDGRVTFGLPNLQGRAVIGAGQGPGLSQYIIGETGGLEATTMTTSEMPGHSHTIQATITPSAATTVSTNSPANAVYGTGTETLYIGSLTTPVFMQEYQSNVTMGLAGSNGALLTMQPVLGLNYVICMYGLFPVRN